MRRNNWIAPGILVLLLMVSVGWGYNQYNIKTQHEVALENNYQRLFFDIKKHVENVQVNLSKALVASSKERNILIFSAIMSDANSARDKLGQMPMSHNETAKTETFLTQAADYSYFLIQKHLDGIDITPEQREQLTGLRDNSAVFNTELATLQENMMESNFLLSIGNETKELEEANTRVFQTSLIGVEDHVSQSAELIYDGPFSEQMVNRKPVGLENKNVNIDEAKEVAKEFFGKDRVTNMEAFEEGENMDEMRIPAHTFHIFPSNQQKDLAVYMGVSKKGGKVLWMANPRPVSNATLSAEEGEVKALEYLQKKGFESMEPNYSLKYDGTVLYNFAFKKDDITIYPDLIKVKIALDTGEVVGFDASAYYLNHQDRNIEMPTIDENQAKSMIKTKFEIDSIRLALIPKGKEEILCYEFKGKYQDSDFIVYINSQTAQEEQILQIIKNENGTLTF